MRAAVSSVALLLWAAGAGAEDPRLERSRAISAEFQETLGRELTAALQRGGPVYAIAVCSEEAPAIAELLSDTTEARVSRTAIRYRNPGNAPDAEAERVLQAFGERITGGASPPGRLPRVPAEYFAVAGDGSARYMRAIVTQPMCLVCHGENLAPPLRAAVAERYPDDRATGFAAGELRGAFVVDWPAEE